LAISGICAILVFAKIKGRRSGLSDESFEVRVKAAGLRLQAAEAPVLEALVRDLDRSASAVRSPMAYTLEPSSAFRLTPPD
jgi:hypothetical protein